jgi:sulfopyruvate decarboxylase subunit beta
MTNAQTQLVSDTSRMPVRDALQVLADVRGDEQVVITNQGSARVWPLIAQHPLDFHYNPSTMGGAVPFALGLALARAPQEVLVISGDGALLMSLGSLVSVAGAGAANLTIVVLDNGIYEVTGGQKIPAATSGVDFAGLARCAGFPTAAEFRSLDAWRDQAAAVLAARGPRFVSLRVEPADPADLTTQVPSLPEQIERLRDHWTG